jgi:hypothetical protein
MTIAKVGDIVEIVFLDHSEGPTEQSFRVFGRVSNRNRTVYVIDCWSPENPSHDDAEGFNRHQYSILRKTIKELYILRRVK